MQLNLKKPIVFFDLETTGVDILHDRIVKQRHVLEHDGIKGHQRFRVNFRYIHTAYRDPSLLYIPEP